MDTLDQVTIKGRVIRTPQRDGAPGLSCCLKLKSLETQGSWPSLQPSDLKVTRGDFEKATKTNALGGAVKGTFQFSNMPRFLQDGQETYAAVYELEVRSLGKVIVKAQEADGRNAKALPSLGATKNYELALGELEVDDQLLQDPFVRSNASLNRGRLVTLDEIEERKLPLNDDAQSLYSYYVVDVDIQDLPAKTRLEEELRGWPEEKRRVWKKEFDQTNHEFVATETVHFWRVAKVVEADKNVNYANDGFEWLTYETVLNKAKFRKSNQPLEYALYTLPFRDVEVFLRNRIPANVLDALVAALFPDHQPSEIKDGSEAYWQWKNASYTRTIRQGQQPQSHAQLQLGGVGGSIHIADLRVVLPYNYYDNNVSSCALGTESTKLPRAKQLKNVRWNFWKTASRSSVAKLERIKQSGEEWTALDEPIWKPWPFWKGVEQRQHVKLASEVAKSAQLKTASLGPGHVSLKTGVCYIGVADQSLAKAGKEACKDFIDANWIVSVLRSDYVVETEAAVGKADDRLLVLTELLSVTEREARTPPDANLELHDGVQIRDLSRLHKDRAYVFPGSIPYLGANYKTLTTAYAEVANYAWGAYWKIHWAAGLARAKALFLMQYGLQHINPNPQNYLIEVSKKPDALGSLSRVVIRDLQDASLHREVAWALYGKPETPPTTAARDVIRPLLFDAFKANADGDQSAVRIGRILQHEFEVENADSFQETGTTSEGFGGPGTKLAWSSFSAGVALTKDQWLKDLEAEVGSPERLNLVINLLADWGMAHAITYVRTLEVELGVEFRAIDWSGFPNFDSGKDIATEETLATRVLHEFLCSDLGQAAIRRYRGLKWTKLKPPIETLVLKKGDSNWPWRIVRFEDGGQPWYRPTDQSATIPIFEALPQDTRYTLLRWTGDYRRQAGTMKFTREAKWEEKRLTRHGTTLEIPV